MRLLEQEFNDWFMQVIKMFNRLFIASLIGTVIQSVKESFAATITAEQWANKELQYQDRMSGMSEKEILKNAQRGRYIVTEKYPEPHRSEHGQNIIENCQLQHEDLNKYGSVQTMKWAKRGKYNWEAKL